MAEKEKTMGFLGPQGTHSDEVACYLAKENPIWKPVAFASIHEAICAVDEGKLDCAVVPVENSLEGSINITLDTLAHNVDLEIEREIVWTVHNQLMVKKREAKITTILSHPQPLAQCRTYLKSHYPNVVIREVSSTARAAQIVAEGEMGYAAICTRRAGALYHLTPVAAEIQDHYSNCTRFIMLRKRLAQPAGREKTSLTCQINGQKAGSLCEVLLDFARHQVNLTRIESRPARTGLGEYIFFLDMEGAYTDTKINAAIQDVAAKSLWMKILGSFNVIKVDQNQKNMKMEVF